MSKGDVSRTRALEILELNDWDLVRAFMGLLMSHGPGEPHGTSSEIDTSYNTNIYISITYLYAHTYLSPHNFRFPDLHPILFGHTCCLHFNTQQTQITSYPLY